MTFSTFSFVFLAALIPVYYLVRPKFLRPYVLLAASWVFCYFLHYMAPRTLLAVSAAVYAGGLLLGLCVEKGPKLLSRCLLFLYVILLAGSIILFKKSLTILNANVLTNPVLINSLIALYFAAGYSYYIFQSISYLVDIYKDRIRAEKNPAYLALYLSFFPKLVSGPLERYDTFTKQVRSLSSLRLLEGRRLSYAASWMLYGYFLKVFVADRLSGYTSTMMSAPEGHARLTLLLVSLMYTLQIYCDFAGYSAIAVGTAKIFGIDLSMNFDTPYLSSNITEFWRRWHMSLSSWLRDYVYIPLGGSRKGLFRKCVNTMIVFIICGLWHELGMGFLVWGLLHGIYSVIDSLVRRRKGGAADPKTAGAGTGNAAGNAAGSAAAKTAAKTAAKIAGIVVTFAAVSFAWIFFACPDLDTAIRFIHLMLVPGQGQTTLAAEAEAISLYGTKAVLILIGAFLTILMDLISRWKEKQFPVWFMEIPYGIRYAVSIAAILAILILGIYGPGYNASKFLYMQF